MLLQVQKDQIIVRVAGAVESTTSSVGVNQFMVCNTVLET